VTYIECGDDLFEIKFSQDLKGLWYIQNTKTLFRRLIKRT